MKVRVRAAARRLSHASGALALHHRLRNRATLTVAMFHRILSENSPEAAHADPRYSLSARLFAACLRFFAHHYAVVGLPQVLASRAGGPPLPPRALLITFDDGWTDNLAVALPLLRAAGLPAVVFVAADPLADPTPWWWQEVLLRALRLGRADFAALWEAAGSGSLPRDDASLPRELSLLARYAGLDAPARARALAPFLDADLAAEGRHMLDAAGLAAVTAGGLAIGTHGAAHLPLTLLADPAADLVRAQDVLAAHLPGGPPHALSFPHGRYDAAVLAAARATGFRLLFTSDPCLNATSAGRPGALLGRISVEAAAITDTAGRFAPDRAATWLFHRPIRRLDPHGLR